MNLPYYFQILNLDTYDCSPSFIVVCKEETLLFNVGEGLQRMYNSHSIKISSISSILFTSLLPHSVGGMPGFMLSLEQANNNKYCCFGPEGLDSFIGVEEIFLTRNFSHIPSIIIPNEVNGFFSYSLKNCTIFSLPLVQQSKSACFNFIDNINKINPSSCQEKLDELFVEYESDETEIQPGMFIFNIFIPFSYSAYSIFSY
jgi:ribonuclease BN (tRNA processing enzyme)